MSLETNIERYKLSNTNLKDSVEQLLTLVRYNHDISDDAKLTMVKILVDVSEDMLEIHNATKKIMAHLCDNNKLFYHDLMRLLK